MAKSSLSFFTLVFLLTATSAIMIGPYPTRSTFQSGSSDVGVDYESEPLTGATAPSKNQPSLPFAKFQSGKVPDVGVDYETEPLTGATASSKNQPSLPLAKFQSGKVLDVGADYETEPLTGSTASSKLKNELSSPFQGNPDPLFIDVGPEHLHAAISSDMKLEPALPFRVNPDPLFIQAAVSSDLNLEPALPYELNPDRRFIHVETEPLHVPVSSDRKTQPQPSTRTDTPTSKISVIVGVVMLVYIALAAICFVGMVVLSFRNAPKYRIVKDGDFERVQLKREDLESGTLFCGAFPCVKDSERLATMLDVHVDFAKEWLRELFRNDKFRRLKHAVDQTNIILKALGFPIIFGYIVARVTWPALVIARPWPADLESINRVRP